MVDPKQVLSVLRIHKVKSRMTLSSHQQILCLLLLLLCAQVFTSPDLSINDHQYAELYSPDESSEQYEIISGGFNGETDDPQLNAIHSPSREFKAVTKSPESFSMRKNEKLQRTQNSFIPVVATDEPYYVVPPQLLRSKRGTSDANAWWKQAWQERHERYINAQRGNIRSPGVGTPVVVTNRNKFVRQFDSPREQESDAMGNTQLEDKYDNPKDQEPEPEAETTTKAPKRKRKVKRTTEMTTTPQPDTDDDQDDSEANNVVSDVYKKSQSESSSPVLEIQPSWIKKEPQDGDPRKSQELRDMIVDKHNYLRSQVQPLAGNMLKMEWNFDAQAIAQRWAEKCRFQHDDSEQRRTSQFKCGQNLARGWPQPLSWNLTMQLWFDERKDFTYNGSPRGMVGHYTQLVWAQSYQIGCAYKDCGTFHYYVCDYCPTGNIDSRKYKPYHQATSQCELCPNNCENGLCTNSCPYYNKYGNCDALQKEFQVCTDATYGLQSSCQATCQCQNKIF